MNSLPTLTTDRLLMRVPTPDDAGARCQFVIENREHLAPWEPTREPPYFEVEHWRTTLASGVESFHNGAALPLCLWSREAPDGPILGQITFSGITRGPFQAAYLGYSLDHRHLGHGLMHEGLRCAIDHAFAPLGLHRIMANYMPENEPSARVLERLGFEREGFARAYLHLAGAWRDHVLTALINPRWSPEGATPAAT